MFWAKQDQLSDKVGMVSVHVLDLPVLPHFVEVYTIVM